MEDVPGRAAKPVLVVPSYSAEAFGKLVAWRVIVEMFPRSRHGRGRRAYRAEFSGAEQDKIAGWYAAFYRWHFTTGAPERVRVKCQTLDLLRRASNFFGGL